MAVNAADAEPLVDPGGYVRRTAEEERVEDTARRQPLPGEDGQDEHRHLPDRQTSAPACAHTLSSPPRRGAPRWCGGCPGMPGRPARPPRRGVGAAARDTGR